MTVDTVNETVRLRIIDTSSTSSPDNGRYKRNQMLLDPSIQSTHAHTHSH